MIKNKSTSFLDADYMGSFQPGLNFSLVNRAEIIHGKFQAGDELEFQFKPGGEISARAETIKSHTVNLSILSFQFLDLLLENYVYHWYRYSDTIVVEKTFASSTCKSVANGRLFYRARECYNRGLQGIIGAGQK
jgi:hypothetical protein